MNAYSRLKRVLKEQQLSIPELHRLMGRSGLQVNLKSLYRLSRVLTLAAVLSLAPLPLWAGAAHHASPPPSAAAPARPAASLVAQAWNHLVSVWAKVGCIIDPNGIAIPTGNSTTVSSTNQIGRAHV